MSNAFSAQKKKRDDAVAQAKNRCRLRAHPNVFDLEFTFIITITRLWNYTPQGLVSGLEKKDQDFILLGESDDAYSGHTELRPKQRLDLYPSQDIVT